MVVRGGDWSLRPAPPRPSDDCYKDGLLHQRRHVSRPVVIVQVRVVVVVVVVVECGRQTTRR